MSDEVTLLKYYQNRQRSFGNEAVNSDAEVPTQTGHEGSAWKNSSFHFAQTKREPWSTLTPNTGHKTAILFTLGTYIRVIHPQTHSFQWDNDHFVPAMELLGTENLEENKPADVCLPQTYCCMLLSMHERSWLKINPLLVSGRLQELPLPSPCTLTRQERSIRTWTCTIIFILPSRALLHCLCN